MDLGQSLNIQDQEATIVSLEQMNETEASTKENQNADDAARASTIRFYELIARAVSLASVIIEGGSFVISIGLGFYLHHAAFLANGLSGIVDWVATVIVVWRFFSGSESDKPEVVEYRELKGVCLGMLMITISIIFESLYHMITQSRPQDDMMGSRASNLNICLEGPTHTKHIFSLFYQIGFRFLSLVKFRVAYVLKSGSLFKDAIMGITAVIVGIGILISSKLYIYTEKSVWYLDSIIGLMIGGLLYTVALSTLISEWDHKWWTLNFWRAEYSTKGITDPEHIHLSDMGIDMQGGIDLSDFDSFESSDSMQPESV